MASLASLFTTFLKIGTFTIGGGYAMIPLMEKELVDRHHWIERTDFLDLVSLSQSMPGVFAVNMATSIGYRLRDTVGVAAAVTGNIAMPIVIILLLAFGFHTFNDNEVVRHIFMGLRPAVVALIAAPVFTLARSAGLTWHNAWIPVLSALLIVLFGVNPIWVILAAVLLGVASSKIKLLLLLSLMTVPSMAQNHELGGWSSLQINKSIGTKGSLGIRGEMRGRAELHDLDLAFLRAMAGYRITPWLNGEVAVDHLWRTTVDQNRLLFSATATVRRSGFTLSVRQRYVYGHNCSGGGHTHLMRTMANLSHPIGESRYTPYISAEGYYWSHWQMTNLFAGTKIKMSGHSTVELYYVCSIRPPKELVVHSLGIGYSLKF